MQISPPNKSAIAPLLNVTRSGKNVTNKMKIAILLGLRLLQKVSPETMKKKFNYPARYFAIETDARFKIGTLEDLFVLSSTWERQVSSFFNFQEKMVFLDVGAHVGKYTIRAGLRVGKTGKVIAIEPSRENFAILVENIRLNHLKNSIPLNIAAYNADIEIPLFKGSDSAKNSLKEDSNKGSHKVRARPLDMVLEELEIEKVDLIKIDVEGVEYEVVQGLERTLKNQNPKVFVEISSRDHEKVRLFLSSLGYEEKVLYYLPSFKNGLFYCGFTKNPRLLASTKVNSPFH